MPYESTYQPESTTREEVDREPGPVVVEFGSNGCGFCQAAQPLVKAAMDGFPQVRHIKVEDGRGKPLGRSFRVKLWPTLVFLKDGQLVHQSVRPEAEGEIRQGLEAITRSNP